MLKHTLILLVLALAQWGCVRSRERRLVSMNPSTLF